MKLVEKDNAINVQTFWIFRERYYPHSIEFKEAGYKNFDAQSIFNSLPIEMPRDLFSFLTSKSTHSKSFEGLTSDKALSYLEKQDRDESRQYILKNSNELVFIQDGTLTIIFLKPVGDMMKANAYYDLKGRHSSVVEKKFWIVVSQFY